MESKSLIQELLNLIKDSFPENWIQELENSEDKRQYLRNKVENLFGEILNKFCLSLLSGEYVYNKFFVEHLEELEDYINTNFDDVIDNNELQQLIFDIVKNELINYTKVLIALYRNFNTHVSSLYLYPRYEISFKKRHSITRKITNSLTDDLNDKANLFFYFTEVQIIDHFLNDSNDTLIKLLDLNFFITQTSTINKFKLVVIEKILFLKYKWSLRFFSQNNSSQLKAYIIDGEVKDFTDDTDYSGGENVKLNEWSEYLENHYEENNKWEYNIQKYINDYSSKKFEELTLQQIHGLVKYYKDISNDEKTLSELTTYVIDKANAMDDSIDKFIWEKAVIYVSNNNFSCSLKKHGIDEPKILILKDEIEAFQKKYVVNNFFHEKRLLEVKLHNINNSLENRENLKDFDNEYNALKEISKSIDNCQKKINWSNTHHSLVFQLPYEESLVPSNIEELPYVYYASSFILPLAMNRINNEFAEIKKSYSRMNGLVEGLRSLKSEFKEIEDIKKDLNKNDLKSIENISVFTAIIVFVMSIIPSLKWISSPKEAIYFYSVLAAALCSMILIPLLMRRGFKEISKNWFIFILLAGIILLGSIALPLLFE